jgi:hypothetical protein
MRTDIEHLDGSKRSDVRNEPVNSRSDVHVGNGVIQKNSSRDQQILVKVVAPGRTAFCKSIIQDGVDFPEWKLSCRR